MKPDVREEDKKKNPARGKHYDPDDDKCFLPRNVIYTVIRIVAPDFPCGWCIMTTNHHTHARTYARARAGSGSFSTAAGRREMLATKKTARARRSRRL